MSSGNKHEPVSLFSKASLISFVSGGVAGATSRTVVSPLERLKIIQQIQGAGGGVNQYQGVWRSLVRMWKEEGFRGYMRGNGVNCLRIVPYSAVQFTTYERMKELITSHGFELNTPTRLGAGAIAGIVAVTMTYPLDLVRARMSVASATFARLNQASTSTQRSIPPTSSPNKGSPSRSAPSTTARVVHASRSLHSSVSQKLAQGVKVSGAEALGVWAMTLKVMREEGGIRALYRGLIPTALGIAPYNGINFAAYEYLKELITPANKKETHTTARRLATGALSGTISQTLTYPLDVLRRKSQLASAKGFVQYNGAIDAAIHTVKKEGIKGLYRGMWPNLLKVAPAMSVSFWTYETVKVALKSL